jgi:hypothetical protein
MKTKIFLLVISLVLLGYIIVDKSIYTKDELNVIVKQNYIDSLNDEIFNTKAELGRYELSLDHLNEVNPKAGKEFETYFNTQTE